MLSEWLFLLCGILFELFNSVVIFRLFMVCFVYLSVLIVLFVCCAGCARFTLCYCFSLLCVYDLMIEVFGCSLLCSC